MWQLHRDLLDRGAGPPVIPVSVLLSFLFVGIHWILWVLGGVVHSRRFSMYDAGGPFLTVSLGIVVLLLIYLAVDMWTHWNSRVTGSWSGVVVFGVAALLLVGLGIYLLRFVGLQLPFPG